MKVTLTITVDVDTEGLEFYHTRWPGCSGETLEQTLGREAIANWDMEGLLAVGTEETVERFEMDNGPEARELAEYLNSLEHDNAALRADLRAMLPLMAGWREVIAEIDDLPKSEALGKAMWACLNQIDDHRTAIRAVLEATK